MHLAVSLNLASAAGQAGLDFSRLAGFVRKAEAAGLDMVVVSDSAANGDRSTSPFEATTLLAALATVTERIGLVASASTLAHQPYNLARRFASLDIISHGRTGWNATMRQNPREATNFSRPEGFSDDDFYRRAEEFIGIVQGLWQGWDADALLFDKASGRFHDPGKMHLLDHKGEFFSVRGPLNVARSPQDTPVLVMSGLTEDNLDFAVRAADVVLLDGQPSARVACGDLKRRALAAGRKPESLKVFVTVAAERLEPGFDSNGCDGLNFALPAYLPSLEDFTDRVLPGTSRPGSIRRCRRDAAPTSRTWRGRRTMSARQMKLGAFLWATGHHIAAWRHPQAHVKAGIDIDHYIRLARTAEAAKLDMIFCEDAAGLREANVQIASQTSRSIGFEPISLLAAIAVQTGRIGLVSTASTSYNEPYGLARTFASLDLLSGGRAGWNLVTSASHIEAANFGSTGLRPHADRYERAREFAQVVTGLWRGAGNGGLNHDGQSFSVKDALDLPRSPQGAPVMVQAGASEDGKDLAARTADVVFSAAQTFDEAKAFYDDVKRRLAAYGREPDDVKIMPGVAPVVATTEAEARAKHEQLQELIPDEVGVALLSSYLSISDLGRYPIDGPLPELPESEG
ncbi:hypothetical protein MesoLj131a_04120 [Mesorhizobium sp. 131-2-1]|nr:hypothetical protein MesoLj131a_04120 [Mesorhizobium sp. 131-2-1]